MGSTIIGLSNQKKLPQNFPLEGPCRSPRSTPGGPWGVNFKKEILWKGGPLKSACLDLPRSTVSQEPSKKKKLKRFSVLEYLEGRWWFSLILKIQNWFYRLQMNNMWISSFSQHTCVLVRTRKAIQNFVRNIYYLPNELEVGRNSDFGTKIAQIGIFQGSQLWKNISFGGLFLLIQ